jgi:uncharacterized protein (TIGR03118 family)
MVIGLLPDGTPTMHIKLQEVPVPGQPATPIDTTGTGIVVNTLDSIQMDINGNCARASLIVAAQSGKIWGVNPDLSMENAFVLIDKSASKAQFTGVALLPPTMQTTSGGDKGGGAGVPPPAPTSMPTLLAVDFHNGVVDVFDQNLRPMVTAGTPKFEIPNLPTDFSPFGILVTGDTVVLTAAQRRMPLPGEEQIDQQVPGDNKGIVAAFDLSGNLIWSVQSPLFKVPWGLALGDLRQCATGALLVGQHGNATQLDGTGNQFGGTITAMDINNGRVFNALLGTDGTPAKVQGLWGLAFGTDISNFPTDLLHVGAGPEETRKPPAKQIVHGLFARLDPTTTSTP